MNTPVSPPRALRKALATLAQRQPSPPEGMAERFMTRLAAAEAEGLLLQKPRRRRNVLPLVWLSVAAAASAAAAVIVGLVLLWPQPAADHLAAVSTSGHVPVATTPPCEPPTSPQHITYASQHLPATIAPTRQAPRRIEHAQRLIPTSQTDTTAVELPQTMPEPITPAVVPATATTPTAQPAAQILAADTHEEKPRTPFSDRQRELDRQAYLSQHSHARLIIDERIAADRISAREILQQVSTAAQTLFSEQPKPIAI